MLSDLGLARCAIGAALLTLLVAPTSSAQRGTRAEKPTGAEIALKARTARLDRASAGKGEFQGKPITFTPALLPPSADLASGQVIGVLENEIEGDETGLPPGKYNVFAAHLEDGWHVYAESDGQVVREALRVELVQRPGQAAEKRPRIRPKGWGVDIDYTPRRTYVPPPAVATVKVASWTYPMPIGESRQFAIELRDAAGNLLTGRSITWTSNAPGVVSTPSLGVVRAMAPGTATITATSEGKSASVTLQVPQLSYAVYFGPATATNGAYSSSIAIGNPITARASVLVDGCSGYANACPRIDPASVVMSNSSPAIASVERIGGGSYSSWTNTDWKLTGLAEGTTDLTFTSMGATTTVRLTVTRARAASLVLAPSPLSVIIGQSQQLTAAMKDASGGPVTAPVTWASSAASIADVTSTGRVAGVALGTATITATGDGISTSVPVHVMPLPVASVTVSPAPVSVEENQWTALTATPKDAAGNALAERNVIWSVNNTAIAEVTSSGRVIGVMPGTAIVTATSEGRSGTATVTVTAPAAAAERPTETFSFNW